MTEVVPPIPEELIEAARWKPGGDGPDAAVVEWVLNRALMYRDSSGVRALYLAEELELDATGRPLFDRSRVRGPGDAVGETGRDRPTSAQRNGAPAPSAPASVYRDWRDFTDRVARPWIENDGDDARVDNWYHTLMIEADPWYLACALVFADNRIRALEAAVPEPKP